MFAKNDYIAHRREKDGEVHWLSHHLKAVSKISGEFAAKIGLKDQGELTGLLHDIGKSSKEFQDYIKSAVGLINPDEDDYGRVYYVLSRRDTSGPDKAVAPRAGAWIETWLRLTR